ncbi:DUF484 family protein [Xinfangfangia sp. D13-10-4-6]|uniref:DUF484 family protein n=1 Tax=Pseudogemmobacter hezensis TaxID=2737662 RepID=UPI001556BB59|nr:DUF484 family protein [Pseudogemmobacter hezensis]NPD15481.1 DUF484 family protein [Pseudogemmobacter hezensis]
MIEPDLRDRILAEPENLLDDRDLMNALVAANERTMGSNVVDLRGLAMQRLESKLDRLEDTHRSVIAAAYENLAGTNQIHRAILQMLDPLDFSEFLAGLSGDVAATLRVDRIRLVLESAAPPAEGKADPAMERLSDVMMIAGSGFTSAYIAAGRTAPLRIVTLRPLSPRMKTASEKIYGAEAGFIGSEALLRLDFGPGRLPGMLALGAEDPHQFRPTQGTDLLTFFAGIFERSMRRWLS